MTGTHDVSPRDDRLLAPTLWTARLIIPVLVTGWALLYLFPGSTRAHWAWTISPETTPLVMGAGYLSGAYFFARVATVGRWHRVAWGFVATTVFTSLLLLATILHWDRFNHDHAAFWAWLALYLATPPLLPLLYVRNRAHDPGGVERESPSVPRALRGAMAAAGVALLALVLVLSLRPDSVAEHWPWAITPLTARTLAAFMSFPAVVWLCFLLDSRWDSFEIPLQTITIGLALVALGALRAHDDFRGRPSVPVFVVALTGAICMLVAVQVGMRRPARRAPHPTSGGTTV